MKELLSLVWDMVFAGFKAAELCVPIKWHSWNWSFSMSSDQFNFLFELTSWKSGLFKQVYEDTSRLLDLKNFIQEILKWFFYSRSERWVDRGFDIKNRWTILGSITIVEIGLAIKQRNHWDSNNILLNDRIIKFAKDQGDENENEHKYFNTKWASLTEWLFRPNS